MQAVPLYLSEMAPPQLRGGLNIMFQMATTIGEHQGASTGVQCLLCLLWPEGCFPGSRHLGHVLL